MKKKDKYEFDDLVYVGKKFHFVTPGKIYQVITENIESLIDGGTGYGVKSFTGDDKMIHIISNWGDKNDLKFITQSEFRDLKINKILIW
jgi:hypothetical protein